MKVFAYFLLKKYNIFGYNDTGVVVITDSVKSYIEFHKNDKIDSKHARKH